MLRRSDIKVLIRPNHAWPLWSSLLLHVALFSVCCIPHAPKVYDSIMVDLEMPRLGSPGPMGGVPAHRPKNAPTGKAVAPAPTAVPARYEPHKQMPPAKPQAVPVPKQKANAPQTPIRSPVDRGADASATAKGQAMAASAQAQAGGTSSGVGKGNAIDKASGAGGTGSGGSGGANRPVDGVFGAQGGPSYLHKVLPVYPRFAQRIGKEGTVLLRLTLDEDGILKAVEIVEKAGHGFDEAAVAAVRASRFRPAIHHGAYVACRAMLPVRFELKD
jgi:periplasmic protein TonB